MIRTVKWKSVTELACASCDETSRKAVILCVTTSKVASEVCPEHGEDQTYSYSTVEASILTMHRSAFIDPPKWEYIFSYNDNQLVSGQVLVEADIAGAFCDGCLAQWARETVGDESYVKEEEDGTFTFVSQHGCEYPIAAEAGVLASLDYIFGDGPDGDLTVLNGQNLILPSDRNYYFNDLTINEGGTLRPNGPVEGCFQQIFVYGTLTVNGNLIADGESGANQVAGQMRATILGGAANSQGTGGSDDAGGIGGDGAEGANPATNGGTVGEMEGGSGSMAGGFGGQGGDGGGGGTGGDAPYNPAAPDAYIWKAERFIFDLDMFGSGGSYVYRTIGGGSGGSGGGGGGRDGGTSAGGAGGGGGAGAGCLYIAARNIVIGLTGQVSANGGDGGNASNGVQGSGDGAGGGGGGAGAGGGLVYLIYEDLINNGIIEAEPGVGGGLGAGFGTLADGEDGEDGSVGTIHLFNMTTGVMDSV